MSWGNKTFPCFQSDIRVPVMVQPGKQASQFNLGGPVCIDKDMPKTESAWAKQSELYGSQEKDMDPYHKPVVSAMKARELAGHTNLFGKPPCFSPPRTLTPVCTTSNI